MLMMPIVFIICIVLEFERGLFRVQVDQMRPWIVCRLELTYE